MRKTYSLAILSFLIVAGCGGGGNTSNFETDQMSVEFSKGADAGDLPSVSRNGDSKVVIECGGQRTSKDGFATIMCKKSDLQDEVSCDGGKIVSANNGATDCGKITLDCRTGDASCD